MISGEKSFAVYFSNARLFRTNWDSYTAVMCTTKSFLYNWVCIAFTFYLQKRTKELGYGNVHINCFTCIVNQSIWETWFQLLERDYNGKLQMLARDFNIFWWQLMSIKIWFKPTTNFFNID